MRYARLLRRRLQHADLAARLTLTKILTNTLNMPLRASDIVPISEARARLTELAEDVVGSGSEKVLTKNGASYVALVDARRLDYYHALEAEHANLVLAEDAVIGLREALAGQFVSDEELDQALGVASRP
jgi:PHD/YefM family antitoxin component YafN of YafNO toxin-antitoxin module